jgi:hypothetical protein
MSMTATLEARLRGRFTAKTPYDANLYDDC